MGTLRSVLVVVLSCAAVLPATSTAAGTDAADGSWWSMDWPTGRYGQSAVYDAIRHRMIVFGGNDRGHQFADVWLLALTPDPPRWIGLGPLPLWPGTPGTPPSPRYAHTAIHDPVRDRVIVFGGFDGVAHNDVWALSLRDTFSWRPIVASGPAPPPRYRHTTVYDPLGDRMIVFGGRADDGSSFGDVWALRLSADAEWSLLTPPGPAPEARYRHSAIYEPGRERMIVFGGRSDSTLDDTWALELAGEPAWSALQPAGPRINTRNSHSAVYDPARDRMVVFGGDGSQRDDVWTLNLAGDPAWTRLDVVGPPPAAHSSHSAVLDPLGDRMIVFGGEIGDTLASREASVLDFGGTPNWSRIVEPVRPTPAGWHTTIHDPVRKRLITFGGLESMSDESVSAETWALSLSAALTWSPVQPSGLTPPARKGHAAIHDPVGDRMIVFGGFSGPGGFVGDVLRDTWALSLSGAPTWTSLSTPTGAPFLSYATPRAVYDPVRHRMIVFMSGEYDNVAGAPTVWALSGLDREPSWNLLLTLGPGPRTHEFSSVVYDALRDRLIVYGGVINGPGGGVVDEIWALSLESQTWSRIDPAGGHPPPRAWHSAIYDPVEDRMVVYGGGKFFGGGDETWELSLADPPAWRRLAIPSPLPWKGLHATVLVPERNWIVVQGGFRGTWGDGVTWVLDPQRPPRQPACSCPGELLVNAATPVVARYVLSNPLPEERRIQWTLASDRHWEGLPMRGSRRVAGASAETIAVHLAVPDSASGGPNRLTVTTSYAGAAGSDVTCTHDLVVEDLTPTLASVVSAQAQPDRVHVEWFTSVESPAIVQRRTLESGWESVGFVHPDRGRVSHDDHAVRPGEHYGYRLAWTGSRGEFVAGEVWVEVPRTPELSLLGLRPNPATVDPAVAFSLPTRGTVVLELYDVAGRRMIEHRVGDMSAGYHVLPLPAGQRLAPGVYVIRLTFGPRTLLGHGVVIR